MKKMHIGFLLFAFALPSCVVSIGPDAPLAVPAPTPAPPLAVVEQEPAPEIVFNEPVYYPPPLVVRYRYDHWMYVVNGPFVDIVFVDYYGVRHVEHWHQGGARMTLAHLPEWHRFHRVPRKDLQIHKERLNEYAIRHPGSANHPPAPSIAPAHLPLNKSNEAPVETRQTAPPVKDSRIKYPVKPVDPKWTAEKKPNTAGKPAATLQQKQIAPKETATVQQKPAAPSKEPTTVQQKPATALKQPPNAREKSKTLLKEPIAGQGRETTVAKKPNKPEKKSNPPEKKPDSDRK
jgi:hypothetical protein